jgi:hypothetical protein
VDKLTRNFLSLERAATGGQVGGQAPARRPASLISLETRPAASPASLISIESRPTASPTSLISIQTRPAASPSSLISTESRAAASPTSLISMESRYAAPAAPLLLMRPAAPHSSLVSSETRAGHACSSSPSLISTETRVEKAVPSAPSLISKESGKVEVGKKRKAATPCANFNRGEGLCDYSFCKYSHVCAVCGSGDHAWHECVKRKICMNYSKDGTCYQPECDRLHSCILCHVRHPVFLTWLTFRWGILCAVLCFMIAFEIPTIQLDTVWLGTRRGIVLTRRAITNTRVYIVEQVDILVRIVHMLLKR